MLDVDYDTYCSMQKQPSKKRKIYLNFGSLAVKKANFRKQKSSENQRGSGLDLSPAFSDEVACHKQKGEREVIKIGKHYVDPLTYKRLDCKVVGEVSCSQDIVTLSGIDRAKMSCKICLSKGDHDTEFCSYLEICPPGVKIDDSVARKFCRCCSEQKCFFRPGEEDKQPGYCMLKGCSTCMTMGDHWCEDCPL